MSDLHSQDIAWLLLEPKTMFHSPHYRQERLFVRSQVLPLWNQPQIVLQLGQIEYLVLKFSVGDACKRSGDPKETKKLLQLIVRPLDDVRRAQLYQTATQTQVLEIFVDGETTRDQLLRRLRGEESGKKLLDDAFVALEKAQQSRERKTAIELLKKAEKGFWEAEKVVNDGRSRELLRERRGELQRTIRGLEEEEVKEARARRYCCCCTTCGTTSAFPKRDISTRLEELRRFAAKQSEANAPRNRTDLISRLAALKNEKMGPPMPVDALAERLRRLREGNGRVEVEADSEIGDSGLERKSAVDCVIMQVKDELSLGIQTEEIDRLGTNVRA